MNIKQYIPTGADFAAVALGALLVWFISGGVPTSEGEAAQPTRELVTLNLAKSENANDVDKEYNELLKSYQAYFESPEEKQTKQVAKDAAEKADEQTLVGENNDYQLQATFFGKDKLAVVMVKSKAGELIETALVKIGDKLDEYQILDISRTQITLASQDAENDQKLVLKLFEREQDK